MDNENKSSTLQERLLAIAQFLPLFEQRGFEFGEWAGGQRSETGVVTMPYYSLSGTAASFINTAYATDWVRSDFDWPSWSKTDEALRLRDDPSALAAANPKQLAQLLTVIIRVDRFSEGSLAAAYESGLLTRILQRAAVLAAAPDLGQFE